MNIGLFAATLGTEAGGMETYEKHFLQALGRLPSTHHFHLYNLSEKVQSQLALENDRFSYQTLRPKNRWLSLGASLPLALLRSQIDLFHPTYVPPFFCPKPYVYTVHSSVTWTHPHFYPSHIRRRVNYLQEKGIREARMLLCVSKHTRDYLADRFKVPDSRLSVVYHGVSTEFKPRPPEAYQARLSERYGLQGPYFLYAGKLKENKNISGLILAHRQFVEQTGSNTKLVLAGRRLWDQGTIAKDLAEGHRRGHVIELGHLDHADMPLLYNSARALVFPSFWEGFGIPILEAQASAIPVLTSNTSSMPEAAGGAALLVDPHCIEDIASAMYQLDKDEGLRQKLITEGRRNAARYTWEQTAQQTLAAYERAL